ncbi:MAG TPA: adenylate kinase [Aciduliprofundum sp.]|nr:adenylate kinase [Aciduliprofundum sp.]
MRAVVTGVPGVGKTTVMNIVAERSGYRIVNFGDLMLEIARERGLVSHRDEIRRLPMEVQRALQMEAGERIGKMADVLVDTHMTIKTPFGYLPGLPEWVLKAISPGLLIIIEASPEEILARRVRDSTRMREAEELRSIEEHQMVNRMAAFAYAALTGAFVLMVENREGKPEEAAERILEVLGYGGD